MVDVLVSTGILDKAVEVELVTADLAPAEQAP